MLNGKKDNNQSSQDCTWSAAYNGHPLLTCLEWLAKDIRSMQSRAPQGLCPVVVGHGGGDSWAAKNITYNR